MTYLRDFNLVSVLIRMMLAFLCGGLIGLEREKKRKPAGLRTHILVCVGASMTTLLSQFMLLELHMNTDPARLGAAVISGIGFIGAGVIIFTRQRRVKGLTTAAGLWICGIVGLSCGAGYYEGALAATLLIMLAETVFIRIEDRVLNTTNEVQFLINYRDVAALNAVLSYVKELDIQILALDVMKDDADSAGRNAELTLLMHRKVLPTDFINDVGRIDGVRGIEIV